MWRSVVSTAAVALLAVAAAGAGAVPVSAQEIPQTPGWELVIRCVMCHSVEIAVQQRLGPRGWSETLDRMITYGAPIAPADKEQLMAYLLRHFRDPEGR